MKIMKINYNNNSISYNNNSINKVDILISAYLHRCVEARAIHNA